MFNSSWLKLKKMSYLAKIVRFRANPTKETSESLHVRVSFSAKNPSDLEVEEVLKQAKVLKDSIKFKNVFFNKTRRCHTFFN